LGAPPLVATSVFKDEMDEGACDERNHWYIKLTETQYDEYIHDTDDQRFYQDSLYSSGHLL